MRNLHAIVLTVLSLLLLTGDTYADSFVFRQPTGAEGKPSRARSQAKRIRPLLPDVSRFKVEGLARGSAMKVERELTANMFEDLILPLRLERVEHDLVGSYVWTGRVAGKPASSVTIAVNGESMSAVISDDSGTYEIRPAGATHEVREIDPAKFPDELPPLAVSTTRTAALTATADAARTAADSGATVDVLVAYTNNILAAAEFGSHAAVQAFASAAVTSTNTAYANSAVTPRLRLVGTVHLAYDDSAAGFSTILQSLANPADGVMDTVQAQRNTVGADVVSLLVYEPVGWQTGCGIGYLMTSSQLNSFAELAYNVVLDLCVPGNFTFAHEVGHNFGLAHDRANAVGDTPSRTYAFGYQDTTNVFRDVMSYNCAAGCPRVNYFSNPDILYNGRAMGVNHLAANSADNARALNDNATIIANWRQTVVAGVTFTDDPLVAGTTPVKAIHITELRNAINTRRAAAALPAATWTDASPGGVVVKAAHINEMRAALAPALNVAPTYTDTLSSAVAVKAVHIQELRNLLK